METNLSPLDKHYFLLRRLHSLTGIVPVGIFLIFHLITNSSIIWGLADAKKAQYGHAGVATFQHEVDFIHSMPFLLLIEIFGLWLPILFHSVLGFYYAFSGKSNTARYAYQDNWRYTLQRISGYVGFIFIFYHVATLRWGWDFLVPGGTKWSADYAASTLGAVLQGLSVEDAKADAGMTAAGFAVSAGYMLGVTLLVFHFANGLWTAAITWGLTISEAAQQRWGFVCAGLGAALMVAGWAAVIGYATLDVEAAQSTEIRMRATHTEPKPPETTDKDESVPDTFTADAETPSDTPLDTTVR